MAGSSKILTVSYGTFSCTLEGFDDPFGTMRDIAEYFRDLAADDRYFGAEPPTPDAEMLHRIAEAETKRRVEARVGSDSILLRQVEEAPAAPRPAPIADQDDPSENMFADIGDADDEATRTDTVAGSGPLTEGEPGDTVAAKLSRIRAVVTRGIVPEPAAQFGGSIQSAFDDAEAKTANDVAPVAEEAPTVEVDVDEDVEAASEAEAVEDLMALDGVEAAPEMDAEAEVAPEMDAEAEADMWSAPSSVLEPEAEAETEVAAELDANAAAAEDAFAEPTDTAPADHHHVEQTVESTAASVDAPERPEDEVDDSKSGLAARIIRLKRAAMGEAEAAPAPVTEPLTAHEIADSPSEPAGALADDEDDDMPDERAPEAAEAEPEDVTSIFEEPSEIEDGLNVDFDLDDPFGDNVKTPAFDDAAADDAAPEVTDVVPTQADAEDEGLAALIGQAVQEANTPESEPEAELADEAAELDEADDASVKRRSTLVEPEESGEAFDRILEQTNNRMDDSEGNRRRSAIAHLKAAVAATKADRLMKRRVQPDEELEEEQSRYRDDLAKVVRPRPTDDAAGAEDAPTVDAADDADLPLEDAELDEFDLPPETKKSERRKRVETRPLILVSEQQIIENAKMGSDGADDDFAAAEDHADADETASEGDFANFAQEMGATELPDLLEAAAAYCAFVEGRAEFSRPQIMRRVVNFNPEKEITREAGLRSFGQLLRQGKIQKLKRGQFTISEDSRFNPRSRIAGE